MPPTVRVVQVEPVASNLRLPQLMEDSARPPGSYVEFRVRFIVGVDGDCVAAAAESGGGAVARERHVFDPAHPDGVFFSAAAAVHEVDAVLCDVPPPHHAADLHAPLGPLGYIYSRFVKTICWISD